MSNFYLYILLLIMTVMGSFGGFFFKRATSSIKDFKSLIFNLNLYIGGGLYFFSALINIFLLKYLPYVVVLPMTAITYIWTLLISYRYFNEKIGLYKKIGVFLIIIGAILITKK